MKIYLMFYGKDDNPVHGWDSYGGFVVTGGSMDAACRHVEMLRTRRDCCSEAADWDWAQVVEFDLETYTPTSMKELK